VPYLKGAGKWVPPGTANGPIVAESCEQGAASREQIKALAKKPADIAAVIGEYRKADLRPLWLGQVTYRWIAEQPDRAKALREVKSALVREDLATAAGRVDRYVAIYWVARLFGLDEAQSLRVAAIRELVRLVARNQAEETYSIRKGCEAPARALWRRMVRERLTAAIVRNEVFKIRPRRSLKMKAGGVKFGQWLRAVPQLSAEQARTLMARLADHCERLSRERKPAA